MAGHFPHLLSIFLRESKSETGAPSASGTIQLISVFNALTIVGFLFLGAVLLTALLSPNVRRIPTWYSLFATWMGFALSYFLLVGQQIGPDPGFGICLTQAGLVYAAPVLAAFSGATFVLQFYLMVSTVVKGTEVNTEHVFLLLLIPPVLHVGIFVEVLVLGLLSPKIVQREESGMYCHLTSTIPKTITGALASFGMLTMLTFEVLTAIIVYRHWATLRPLPVRSNGMISLTMIIRFAIFSVAVLFSLALSTIYIPSGSRSTARLNVIVATLPTLAALIFGTQADIFCVWMFWKKDVPPPVPMKDSKPKADVV